MGNVLRTSRIFLQPRCVYFSRAMCAMYAGANRRNGWCRIRVMVVDLFFPTMDSEVTTHTSELSQASSRAT